MCIVIDTNTLSCVFNKDNIEHIEFEPVLQWIVKGKGKIVYGGSAYEQELQRARTFLKLFGEFDKINKIVSVDKAKVDKKKLIYDKTICKNRSFDDSHIMAIVAVSGVKLICTNERRSIPFLTNNRNYPRGKRPRIYSSKKNVSLLTDRNIADCCKPSKKLSRNRCEQLLNLLKKS